MVAPIVSNLLPMLLPAPAFSLLVVFLYSGVVWLFVELAVVVFALEVVVFRNVGPIFVVITGLVLLVIFFSVAASIVVIAIGALFILVVAVVLGFTLSSHRK